MAGHVKICGIRTGEALAASLEAGADMVGFVRFTRSPRHVGLDLGRELSEEARGRSARVLLLVDPDDRELDEAVLAIEPDIVQLHGRETPERVAAVAARTGRPVMKAVSVATVADLDRIAAYRGAAERILLDAKPGPGALLPGGNGVPFDWAILAGGRNLAGLDPGMRLVLSGGLDPDNVARAIAVSRLTAVDVSSGVERRPGEKDSARIAAFVQAARAALAGLDQRRVA